MIATHRHIDRFWESDWSLTALLVFLLVFVFFVQPLDVLGYDGKLVGAIAFSLILLSGIATVARSRLTAALYGSVALVSIATDWARYAIYPAWIGPDAVASMVACAMLAAIVLVRVFRAGPITVQRIQGAVRRLSSDCPYLLGRVHLRRCFYPGLVQCRRRRREPRRAAAVHLLQLRHPDDGGLRRHRAGTRVCAVAGDDAGTHRTDVPLHSPRPPGVDGDQLAPAGEQQPRALM